MEYSDVPSQQKRAAVLSLLGGMLDRGVPVQALGIQGHLDGARTDFSADGFVAFLQQVAGLGLRVLITEMNVSDKRLRADVGMRDAQVAGAYRDFLAAPLSVPAVIVVMTWGISDRSTWLSTFAPCPDGLPVRPLPLDADLARKAAWAAIANAFDEAPGPVQT